MRKLFTLKIKGIVRLVLACSLFLLSIGGFAGSALAQSINTIQDLTFGEAVLTDNSSQREILLSEDGSFTNDPEYLFVTTPEPGIYQVVGQTPSRTITSVTVTVNTQPSGGGRQFIIDNFDVDHPPSTDPAGEATIRVGARFRSTGDGTTYPVQTTFNGNLQITVNYL